MSLATLVWCGRFQPFHNGHLATLRHLAEVGGGRRIIVGVLSFVEVSGQPKGHGDLLSDGVHNPLSAFHRSEMINEVIAEENIHGARAVCLPRTDIFWGLVSDMLPADREICLVRRGGEADTFESEKLARYRLLGERVRVIGPLDGAQSGTAIRAELAAGNCVEHLLPSAANRYLARHNLLDSLIAKGN